MFSTDVLLLSRLNPYRQTILLWRQRARRELRERARWVVGSVEIDDNFAVSARRICVKITPRSISVLPVGLIGKDNEQLLRAFFQDRIQSKRLTVRLENQRARRGHLIDHTQHVCD